MIRIRYGEDTFLSSLANDQRQQWHKPGHQCRIDFLADASEPVDARLNETELRELVRNTIDSMPDHLREILLLAYFQRLSYQDIAATLGIPLGTVKSRLHAAVVQFADRWRRVSNRTGADLNP